MEHPFRVSSRLGLVASLSISDFAVVDVVVSILSVGLLQVFGCFG